VIGDGQFAFPIVGESHYQDALETLAGGRSGQSAHQLCAALLQPEPDNPHDRSAVSVRVRGQTVGYLDRDTAPDFLAAIEEHGFANAACEAVIVGGWRRPGEADGHFGLKLNAVLPFTLVDPEEPRIARARRETSRRETPRSPPRIVRIVKRKRGFFGWTFLLLFALFNLFMAAWLAAYWPAGLPLAAANALAERIAVALGFSMGVEVIAGIWLIGAIVLGLLALFIRGRNALVKEVTEDWARFY
jgi:hypothetical protein